MYSTYAWAKKSKEGNFEKISIKRNINKDHDVTFELRYCGICHTDVNVAENFFGNALYPCVPGHELAGVVTSVGRRVSRVRVGDKVGVGYFADACKDCHQCDNGIEQFCDKGSQRIEEEMMWRRWRRRKSICKLFLNLFI